MFFENKAVNDDQNFESIKAGLKGLFTKQKEKEFIDLWTKTIMSTTEFRKLPAGKAVIDDGGIHNMVERCDIHFMTIGSTIKEFLNDKTFPPTLARSIEELPDSVTKLKSDLNKLLEVDRDPEHKAVYQETLEELQKIEHCYTPEEPRKKL